MKNVPIGTRPGRGPAKFSSGDARAVSDGPGGCQTTTGGVTRRTALLGLATSFSIGRATLAMASAPTGKRLVVIILRGALDGMAAVSPMAIARWLGCVAKSCRPARGRPMVCSTLEASMAYIRR